MQKSVGYCFANFHLFIRQNWLEKISSKLLPSLPAQAYISDVICDIFNQSSDTFPDDWKKANVSPVKET